MTDDAFKQQIEALVPKSLDDIIRRHREQATIRFATGEDKAPLLKTIARGDRTPVAVSRWAFITLDWHIQEHQSKDVILSGWSQPKAGRCTVSEERVAIT